MKNQKITIVFLAAILVAGATTIASPILIDDASASGDKHKKKHDRYSDDRHDYEKEYDSKYSDDRHDSKYSDDRHDYEKEYDSKYSDDRHDYNYRD
ncbi:MAG TPA: hypothetical protein VF047_09395 [Nitrososphaeraceae archaeon]